MQDPVALHAPLGNIILISENISELKQIELELRLSEELGEQKVLFLHPFSLLFKREQPTRLL